MTRKLQTIVTITCAVLLVHAWTPTASGVVIEFTDSNQLNLTNRPVLSAVNFYGSVMETANSSVPMTGTIQGVTFTNFDHETDVTVGSLTATLPNAGVARGQTGAGITGTGADQAHAIELANSITFWGSGNTGSLSYAFGPGWANKAVQVQIVGGVDAGWNGAVDVEVNSVSQGILNGVPGDADLLTFETVTDGLGNLLVDISYDSGSFYGIAGAIVTADPPPVPEPSSVMLLGMGTLVLIRRARRVGHRVAWPTSLRENR